MLSYIFISKNHIFLEYGGPDGELGASLRYLSQRYSMPYPELKAILTDIGTEELAHLEMVGAIIYQLTRNLTPEQIKAAGMDAYFVDHTTGIYPASAAGVPFTAAYIQSKGDVLTDLHENLAAEQKAIKAQRRFAIHHFICSSKYLRSVYCGFRLSRRGLSAFRQSEHRAFEYL